MNGHSDSVASQDPEVDHRPLYKLPRCISHVDIPTSHKDLPVPAISIGRLCIEDGASYEKHMRHISCSGKMMVSPGTETASARLCTLVSQFHL